MPVRRRRRNSLPLIHEQQFPGAVAPRFGQPQDVVERTARQTGCARENPEVFRRTAAHQRPVVIGAEFQHVVIRIEKPEKRDPQTPRHRRGAGFAARPFAAIRTIVDAAVLDGHPTVGQQFVVRLHTRQPPFERMIVAGDLIPWSHITPQVEHGDRHAVGAVRSRRDSHRTQNQKGGSKQ